MCFGFEDRLRLPGLHSDIVLVQRRAIRRIQQSLVHGPIVAEQLDIQLRVIDLLYGVGLETFASVNQIEAFAVGLVAAMSQRDQSCRKGAYDSPNNSILGFALEESPRSRLPACVWN